MEAPRLPACGSSVGRPPMADGLWLPLRSRGTVTADWAALRARMHPTRGGCASNPASRCTGAWRYARHRPDTRPHSSRWPPGRAAAGPSSSTILLRHPADRPRGPRASLPSPSGDGRLPTPLCRRYSSTKVGRKPGKKAVLLPASARRLGRRRPAFSVDLVLHFLAGLERDHALLRHGHPIPGLRVAGHSRRARVDLEDPEIA